MFELTAQNAAAYLTGRGLAAPDSVTELGGGVSNTVLLVEAGGSRSVLKQSLARLRVEQDWFSDRDRIFREVAALRLLAGCLPPGSVPEVLFEDRDNCLFSMSAAPADAVTWKAQLMAGDVKVETAGRVGQILAAIVRAGWRNAAAEAAFGDQTVFDQLRLDPYYRAIARRHPALAPIIERLMRESARRRCSLVHGDWSPKNFLAGAGSLTVIDFEVIHYGDPAFDAAFLLNHLALKSFYLPHLRRPLGAAALRFWEALLAGLPDGMDWMEAATLRHLGPLMLARVDGKSPAEYLREPALGDRVRACACRLIQAPPASIAEAFESI